MAPKAQSLCIDPHWQGRAHCRTCAMRAVMPFGSLEVADLDGLLQPVDNFKAPAGTRIVDRGASAASVFTIRRGYVKIHDVSSEGRTRIVRLLRPGDVLGLEALAGHPHAHAADAVTAVDVCRIPVAVLNDLERRRPALHQAMLARWHDALGQAEAFILGLLAGPAPGRVARLLHLLADLAHGDPPPRLSRQEIAAACDLTPETVSRIASEWIEQGWLVEAGDTFRIDREALGRFLAA